MNSDYSTPKPMKRIGDLFESYKKRFKAPQASVEKEVIDVFKEVTGFELSPDQVVYTVSTKTLFLQVPSVYKTELRFHHPAVLKELKKRLGEEGAPQTIL